MTKKNSSLTAERLKPISKAFLDEFLAWKPEWQKHCEFEQSESNQIDGECDLYIRLPSPHGDPNLEIQVFFVNDGSEPSLSFGNWHAHNEVVISTTEFEYVELSIFTALQLMVMGDIAISTSLTTNSPISLAFGPQHEIVYLPLRWSIEEALQDAGGRIRVQTWDGRIDQEVSLETIDAIHRKREV
ncbi:MAG TPA: hypothetical protein PLZ57_03275 [Pseudobdellovibrionaceae bacterium]|nr:hypothetical protein [Pseudobdellovibrionaceae bacterium]